MYWGYASNGDWSIKVYMRIRLSLSLSSLSLYIYVQGDQGSGVLKGYSINGESNETQKMTWNLIEIILGLGASVHSLQYASL